MGARHSEFGGSMAAYWTSEDDQILAEIERARKQQSKREIPE
jgi:hypothetical protein